MASKGDANPRILAFTILQEVLEGHAYSTERIDHYLNQIPLNPPDRGLLTQLVYGVLREKGLLDHFLSKFLSLKKTPEAVLQILRLGTYQILALDRIPDHAAIFESVEMAKQLSGVKSSKLVNAVMRRIQEHREELTAEPETWKLSLPDWMLQRWLSRYPKDQVEKLLRYFNDVQPLYLRINQKKTSMREIEETLQAKQVDYERVPGFPLLYLKRHDELVSDLLESGKGSQQDLGSFKVVRSLNPMPGEIGLDACAGHGGKSTAIAESLGDADRFYVYDPSPARLEDLQVNFSRLKLKRPEVLSGPKQAAELDLKFDWILIDAPCSGMGTLGRKPEIRWRLKPADFRRLAKLQRGIIETWLPFLKKGGRLVYSVCSQEPEEGEDVIQEVLKDHRELTANQFVKEMPFKVRHDGFFVACLLR